MTGAQGWLFTLRELGPYVWTAYGLVVLGFLTMAGAVWRALRAQRRIVACQEALKP